MPTAATSARQSLWAVRAAAGEPAAVVRVRNLQATIRGAAVAAVAGGGGSGDTVPDAWGRGGRAQPLLVSAEVQLAQGFQQAAASDSVAADTVHYGTLSKAILEVLEGPEAGRGGSDGAPGATLYDVLDSVWVRLTGRRLDGGPPSARGEQQQQQPQQPPAPAPAPLLAPAHVRALTVTLHLPKAALVGDGVALTAAGLLGPTAAGAAGAHALRLELLGLRVPVLVGVHAHERRARQTVVARVGVDLLGDGDGSSSSTDPLLVGFPQLTQRVVDVLQASAFETLEALAAEVGETVLAWPGGAAASPHRVHVALEKPMAVPFADAPEVAVVVDRASSSRGAPV